MTRLRFLSFVTLCAVLPAAPAAAQSPIAEVVCEPTAQMHDRLKHRLRSARTARGIRDREQIMEVWTDPQGGWTLVLTYAGGTSCIVAMGEAWQNEYPRDPA